MSPNPAPSPAGRRARRLRTAALGLALLAVAAGATACDEGEQADARATPTTTAAAEEHGGHGDHDQHPDGPGRYVSLGDSYTAAPETGPAAEGSVPGCVQSEVDYPHQVAEALGAAEHVDVSCTGATTDDVFAPQAFEDGTEAPAQLDAVTEDTTLVTIGIGGNDIGFADVIVSCLAPAVDAEPCHREIDHGHEGMSARIAATAPKVAEVLAAVADRAPHAEVVLVGYPTIFPASGSCFETVPFTEADVAYLHDVESELNAMLAAQAQEAGATFVDTERSSASHSACTPAGTRWIEGIAPEADAIPFHPNELGATHSAEQVLAALDAA